MARQTALSPARCATAYAANGGSITAPFRCALRGFRGGRLSAWRLGQCGLAKVSISMHGTTQAFNGERSNDSPLHLWFTVGCVAKNMFTVANIYMNRGNCFHHKGTLLCREAFYRNPLIKR